MCKSKCFNLIDFRKRHALPFSVSDINICFFDIMLLSEPKLMEFIPVVGTGSVVRLHFKLLLSNCTVVSLFFFFFFFFFF